MKTVLQLMVVGGCLVIIVRALSMAMGLIQEVEVALTSALR